MRRHRTVSSAPISLQEPEERLVAEEDVVISDRVDPPHSLEAAC